MVPTNSTETDTTPDGAIGTKRPTRAPAIVAIPTLKAGADSKTVDGDFIECFTSGPVVARRRQVLFEKEPNTNMRTGWNRLTELLGIRF